MNYLIKLLVPIVTTVIGAVFVTSQTELLPVLFTEPLFRYSPFLIFGVAFLLGVWFNQTHYALFSLFCVLGIGGVFLGAFPMENTTELMNAFIVSLCGVTVLLHFTTNRSMVSPGGLLRLLPVLIAGGIFYVPFDSLWNVWHWVGFLPHKLLGSLSYLPGVSVLTVLILLVALCVSIVFNRKGKSLDGKLLAGCLLSMVAACLFLGRVFQVWPVEWEGQIHSARGAGFIVFSMVAGLNAMFSVLELTYGTAFLDPLTGLPGRTALNHRFASLGRKYLVGIVDVDHFKKINDKYGHDVGDEALRFVASMLQKVNKGKAYRYGGEEFVVVYGRTSPEEAVAELEQLRADMAACPFFLRKSQQKRQTKSGDKAKRSDKSAAKRRSAPHFKITVSIGLATSDLDGVNTPEEVLVAADKSLYKAKESGRNCLVGADKKLNMPAPKKKAAPKKKKTTGKSESESNKAKTASKKNEKGGNKSETLKEVKTTS